MPAVLSNIAMRVEQVEFGYVPGRPVLRGVSATLAPGRVCALLGPNASGKSTLLKVMLGLLQTWRGTVHLGDRQLTRLSHAQRARWLSFVPQRGGAAFGFTVRQVVSMGRFALNQDEAAVDHAMERCGVADLSDRVLSELSVGQQQLVLLARAVAQSSGAGVAMLLDEPTSAMDLRHVIEVMALLRELALQRGVAVLTVLHDLNLAARHADDVWLMDHGGLVAAGTWDSVLLPELLDPVYRVRLRQVGQEAGRPVFCVRVGATLS